MNPDFKTKLRNIDRSVLNATVWESIFSDNNTLICFFPKTYGIKVSNKYL